MKKTLLFLFIISFGSLSAQTVSIPDQGFEEALIHLGIDSDGVVNGQVLNTDVENVITLIIDMNNLGSIFPIYDLTGLASFINLEELVVNYTYIPELDVSQNIQLKILDCANSLLTSIDVSANLLLEELYCGNYEVDFPLNEIVIVDLTNNPNIRILNVENMSWSLQEIYLENGYNNADMFLNVSHIITPDQPSHDVCLFVDDVTAAQNNEFPYSEWGVNGSNVNYFFVNECTLSSKIPEVLSFSVYPNPSNDVLHVNSTGLFIDNLIMYDSLGRKVLEETGTENLSISHLAPGNYVIKIVSGNNVLTKKIIITN